MKLSGINVR